MSVFEEMHDKTYNKTYAISEDSDQTARMRSLIRVFTDHMCLLQPPDDPKRDKREPLSNWAAVGLVLVFVGHTGLIVGFFVRWLNFSM